MDINNTAAIKPATAPRALITGGASGLGLASARRIIDVGGQVVLLDSNPTTGEHAQRQLGERALFITTDVTNEAEVDAACEQAVQRLGAIDLALSCAGIATSERVLAKDGLMSGAAFARAINVNLLGSFLVCRAAANHMQHNSANTDGERGVIINTASIAAYDGQIGQAAYAASKGGVVSMTLPLAREFARIGVRVVCIAPGLFKTPLFDSLPEKAVTALCAAVPFPKRPGKAREFAELVLHIYRNPMLNGTTIRLDGALRM